MLIQMLRRVVIGSIGVAVLVPTVSAATPVPAESKGLACPPPMKPSELPIYEAPHAEYGDIAGAGLCCTGEGASSLGSYRLCQAHYPGQEVRYGAVAIGGLTGFIFGLRGGIIRILKNNSAFAKQYINIAYNFLYGVKPGDPQLELKLPELTFPKDFSELTDMTMSLACTVYRAVMPPPSKDSTDSKPKDKKE
ncbi:hypothetical protein OBRU01_15176, partial [Operophtera brumata]